MRDHRRLGPPRVLAALLVCLTVALPTWATRAHADAIRTGIVVCTTTRSHVIVSNENRLGGFIQNVGTLHVNIGFQSSPSDPQGTTALFTLHVGSTYNFTPGFRGGVQCVTQPGTGSTAVEWFEEVR